MSTEDLHRLAAAGDADLVDGCGACYADQDLRLLAGDPHLVPDDLLERAVLEPSGHWSPATWRGLWRRFAPRLVALVAARSTDVDRALRSLAPDFADLSAWPDEDRRVLEDALGDVLATAVETWPAPDVVTLLCGLACVHDDLRPWLARVDALTGPAADAGVVRLACHWATSLHWGETDWCTWWLTDDQATPVREWTFAVRPRVVRFAAEHPECKTARDAVITYDRLDRDEPGPWYYPGTGWSRWERMGQPGHYNWLEPVSG
ncbi:hypothetical protein ABZ816_33830 [Actinosynnema sp. NPDC047251]|uniref:Uncharacterized protein n=1 Tax=Saccharothrix espanaensis (strain ATCC 51144 / DSM 44229 / JCM 9112 / NBRC 15066 / NRRL 15764) TaxID=1179773 RepID=K0K929_SACES|nr:hypothetical protein [Saccharothrix espanaensis]CCH33098.1 hypothetical protein BN6_58400 [Saccharothrix espanaensis DSM 44229]